KLARQKTAEIRTGAVAGEDIIETSRQAAIEARREVQTAKAKCLAALIDPYLDAAAKRLRPESLRVARLYLRGQWRALYDRPANDLTRREIASVLQPYAGRQTAIQLRYHLSACLSWAMERGLIERNAAMGVKAPAEPTSRDRVLTPDELRTVLLAARGD